MISSIRGTLSAVLEGRITLDVGPMTLDLFIPSCDHGHWSLLHGQPVTLHTHLLFDSQNQGASFSPRLLGFRSPADRAFFELFTTVKGIGPRKAMKALALPSQRVARAIADRDLRTLQSLPEIGRRLAETIVAELNGKVDPYLCASAGDSDTPGASAGLPRSASTLSDEAVAVLVTLGEPRMSALQLIDRALALDPPPADVESLVTAVYRLRGS